MSGSVGRAAERRVIADAVQTVAHGRGLVLSISGEPGVGKTHLAAQALSLAAGQGFRTLRGTCARYQEDVSFGPLAAALRPLVEPAGPADGRISPVLTDLVRPFTWLDGPGSEPARDQGTERGRMFDAVHALLRHTAADRPVAILIDDVHWADPASLDLLAYLTLSLADDRCLFIVTDRGDPVDAVRRFRALLRRADRVVDVRLGPLDADASAELVAHELTGEPPRPLLDMLDRRARGIPLYLTSLVASLREQGRLFRSGGRWVLGAGSEPELPEGLADVIADRLDELAPSELTILSALGVWGDGATGEMIGALVPEDGELGERIDRLVDARLIDERVSGPVVYHAHHPLVVEAACARLSARERRIQHAAAAHYLLGRPESARPPAGIVAHHVRLAGPAIEPDQALDLLTAAADSASTDGSGHEALVLAEAIAVLIRTSGRADTLPAALERLADASALSGDIPRAIVAWREAAELQAGDPAEASRCLRRSALLCLELGRGEQAGRALAEALALVQGPDTLRERFRVLMLRVTFSLRESDRASLGRDLPALRAASSQIGLTEIADMFDRFADAGADRLMVPSAVRDASILAGQVTASLGSDEDLTLRLPWHRPWIVDAIARGDLAEARRRARAVPERSAASPGSFSAAVALEALAAWLAGEWDEALRLTGQALVTAHRQANPRSITLALTVRGLILAHRGDLDRAQECIADARSIFGHGDSHAVSTIDTVAAQLALLRGRTDQALVLLDQASPVNYFGLLTLSLQAGTAALADDRDRLDRIGCDVQAVVGPWAAAIRRRLGGLGDHDAAALADASAQLAEIGMPYESALVLLESADLNPTDGEAAQRAGAALAVFSRLDAVPAGDRARRLLRRLGHRPPPGRPTGGPLSEREAQVADLVAQGLSNADVAARLFISQRTVTTHLERIYRRLGLSSRAELARYVAEADGSGHGIRRVTDTGQQKAWTD